MKPDLYWIPGPWRGRLAVSGRPRGGDWLTDESRGLRHAGVDVVVSLLEGAEAEQLELSQEEPATQLHGMSFLSFPIPDRGVPESSQAAVSLTKEVAKLLEEGNTVAIHCRQGIGRSGMIAVAVLMTLGVALEKALQDVSAARGAPIPETPAQLDWLRHFPAERPVVSLP